MVSILFQMSARVTTALKRVARRSGAAKTDRKLLGDEGERQAYLFLRRNGYLVVARQWRAPNLNGELDLIAWQGETLCFIEVKTRSAGDRYAPGYRMDRRKCEVLRRMARAYVHGLPWPSDDFVPPAVRFDLVSVLHQEGTWTVDHLQNAFPATA